MSYHCSNTGTVAVGIELIPPSGNTATVTASATTSLQIPAGQAVILRGPANATFSAISASAGSVTITPGDHKE
jgi:hypothetical protein